jgi:hypothetical protein
MALPGHSAVRDNLMVHAVIEQIQAGEFDPFHAEPRPVALMVVLATQVKVRSA